MKKLVALTLAAILTLSAFPLASAADVSTFKDVANHWGAEHLSKLINAGIIVGDGKGYALPDRAVTFSEADVMLSKVLGLEYNYVQNAAMPRENAINLIYGAFFGVSVYLPPWFQSSYTDFDTVSEEFKEAILVMEYTGLIRGMGDGRIAPHGTVTRAEFAALLSNAAGVFIDKDTDFKGAELGRAIIRGADVTVKNLTAEYLFVAGGSGNITLEGCDIGVFRAYGSGKLNLASTNVTELNSALLDVTADANSIVERTIQG
jgi:hypothetical protein